MSAADEFRRHAVECLETAKGAVRPDVKELLTTMAGRWNGLAERMESFAVAETVMDRSRSLATVPKLPSVNRSSDRR